MSETFDVVVRHTFPVPLGASVAALERIRPGQAVVGTRRLQLPNGRC
jgi:hypothetical protein